MYFDNQYLNIISAIEIYHRSTRHPDEDAKLEQKERVDRILSQIENSKDKKYIKGKTKYDYEPSLEDRIFNLLNYCKEEMELFISDFREFAQAASGIRNYLTHRGSNKENEQKAFYSVRGYFIFQISYFLLQISIMKDVGFSGKNIAETIAKSRDMQFEISRSKELFEEGVTYCIDRKLQLSHAPLEP